MRAIASSSPLPASTPEAAAARAARAWAAVAGLAGAATLLWALVRHRLLLYGDATAHLAIARRIVDSATPGPSQLGTVWLPLPHLLMAPFVLVMAWWRDGLAGALPALAAFVLATWFLHRLVRRAAGPTAAHWAAAFFCLNPSLLYLAAIPMTETIYLATFLGLVDALAAGGESPSSRTPTRAGLWALAATLCRYDAWFVLPFAFFFLWWRARAFPWRFTALAAPGPLFWFGYNLYYFKDPLNFLRGPYSARAIQGAALYPGEHAWLTAGLYFLKAVVIASGVPLGILALLGLVLWLRRCRQPRTANLAFAFFLLPLPFYLWAMWSGNVPIFVPQYWPHGFYNLRYGVQLLPAVAGFSGLAVAALAAPLRRLAWPYARAGLLAGLALLAGWSYGAMLAPPGPGVYAEAVHNAPARLAAEAGLARLLAPWRPGQRVLLDYGSFPGALADDGIPVHSTVQESNYRLWQRALAAPQTMDWVVVETPGPVAALVNRAALAQYFQYAGTVQVPGEPRLEVYRRRAPGAAPGQAQP